MATLGIDGKFGQVLTAIRICGFKDGALQAKTLYGVIGDHPVGALTRLPTVNRFPLGGDRRNEFIWVGIPYAALDADVTSRATLPAGRYVELWSDKQGIRMPTGGRGRS